jgi:glycosyltransferase involved in cell wall biosynthesis
VSPNRPSPLGLYDDSEPARVETASEAGFGGGGGTLELSVILPARNEADVLGECLASLVSQDDEVVFALGRDWELIVVDDASTDATRAIAEEVAARHRGVSVMAAPALDLGVKRAFTGKTNACWAGAQQARGRWLLFTDADTLHEPGNLLRALHEAQKHNVALLSYSPRQIVTGMAQRVLMPLVFAELVAVYPMEQINDPARRLAAANGQFLLVEREAYFAVGGHRAVGPCVLEDVELARVFKRSKRAIRFRFAPEQLATRMYRSVGAMIEGWTKNLALLFPHALQLAAWRTLDILLLLLPVLLFALPHLLFWQRIAIMLLWARTLLRFYSRVARSNFSFTNCTLAVFGLPLLVVLLARSWMKHRVFREVGWKGREYRTGR